MRSISLDDRSSPSIGQPLLDHFASFQAQEPWILPDFLHFRTRFGIQIEHAADEGTTRWRNKTI
jgi:hypothetical protein